jgi:hypothetical protein
MAKVNAFYFSAVAALILGGCASQQIPTREATRGDREVFRQSMRQLAAVCRQMAPSSNPDLSSDIIADRCQCMLKAYADGYDSKAVVWMVENGAGWDSRVPAWIGARVMPNDEALMRNSFNSCGLKTVR